MPLSGKGISDEKTDNKPVEPFEESREKPDRSHSKAWLILLTILIIVIVVISYVVFIPFFSETPGPPTVDMGWDIFGEAIEISQPSREEPLDAYKVMVLRDDTPWTDFPKVVREGTIGQGPAGEYLNFTDLTSDGNLTSGDFFILENLQSGAHYEVKLIWAASDVELASETVNVP